MSIIFYHDEQQKMLAELSRQEYEKGSGNQAVTEIMPFSAFYPAEDYHQKYYLSQVSDLYNSYRQIYPEMYDFLASTAVARINGYIGNYGSLELMEKELGYLGLTEVGRQRIYQFTGSGLYPA
jgi:peptide-methionine (S)-S-oxide reductase